MVDTNKLYGVVWCIETSVRGEDRWLLVADTDKRKNCFANEQEARDALDVFVDKDAPSSVRIYRVAEYRKALSNLGAYFLSLDEGGNFEVPFDDDEGDALVREAIELWRAQPSNLHEAVFRTVSSYSYSYEVRTVPDTESGYQDACPYPQSDRVAVRGGNGEGKDERPPALWPHMIRYRPLLAQVADRLWSLGLDYEEFDGTPAVTVLPLLPLQWREGVPQYALRAGDEVISRELLSAKDVLDLLHDLPEGKDRAETYDALLRAISRGVKRLPWR